MPDTPPPGDEPRIHSQPSSRSVWIDNFRTLSIILVVNMHACVTYSHVGGWYIKEAPEPSMPDKMGLIFWQAHVQAFFMGLVASY